MKQSNFTLPALLVLAIAACQQPANDSNIAIDNDINAAEAAKADVETLPPNDSSAAASGLPAVRPTSLPTQIPARFHGRWGLVRADCTSTRGDDKGLLTINDKTVKFYESLATLQSQRPAIATSFSGQYDFSGEGQTWQRGMTFTRSGDTLKRADDEGSFTYMRC